MSSVHFSGSKVVLLRSKQEISSQINALVLSTGARIQRGMNENEIYGVDEFVSAYPSLLIYFNSYVLSLSFLLDFLEKIKEDIKITEKKSNLCIKAPLCYGEEFGLDLELVYKYHNLSKEELIGLYTKPYYLVFMLESMTGFPYLGKFDERLFIPKLANPRTKIGVGSVGIAGKQTEVYPISNPDGWQIIARTPLEFFNRKDEKSPILLKAEMLLESKAISKDEFYDIRGQALKKAYQKEIYEYKNH